MYDNDKYVYISSYNNNNNNNNYQCCQLVIINYLYASVYTVHKKISLSSQLVKVYSNQEVFYLFILLSIVYISIYSVEHNIVYISIYH